MIALHIPIVFCDYAVASKSGLTFGDRVRPKVMNHYYSDLMSKLLVFEWCNRYVFSCLDL